MRVILPLFAPVLLVAACAESEPGAPGPPPRTARPVRAGRRVDRRGRAPGGERRAPAAAVAVGRSVLARGASPTPVTTTSIAPRGNASHTRPHAASAAIRAASRTTDSSTASHARRSSSR